MNVLVVVVVEICRYLKVSKNMAFCSGNKVGLIVVLL